MPITRNKDITTQVKNLRCRKKELIITHVGTNNLQRMGSEKLTDGMKELCETVRAKTNSQIVDLQSTSYDLRVTIYIA